MPEGIDPLRIKRVNVFKSKDDKILCVPVIDGIDKVQPREVSRQQWQRMWVAEDVAQYKTSLAANLFADLLMQKSEEKAVEKQQDEDAAVVRPDVAAVRPELQQYEDLKEKHPGILLLFRNGDNYEAYQDDVPTMEKTLGLAKTEYGGRREGSPAFKVSFRRKCWTPTCRSSCNQGQGWLSATLWKTNPWTGKPGCRSRAIRSGKLKTWNVIQD